MRPITPDSAKPPFKIGNRVRIRRPWVRGLGDDGAETGTILALPPELGGPNGVPAGLYGVLDDTGVFHGLAPGLLELCGDCAAEKGLLIAVQRLHEKREGLLHDMLCLVAATRRADLSDPKTRMRIEAEVKQMSADWSSADAAAVRRKEFLERPELRTRFIKSLTECLEVGELIQQITESIDGD